ncbi:Hypothetical predicted protein [Mytilus galloprovincialis]|uniref:Uncharacterized protein n=1 Tax=Mytilus galloprovincialis TaxID=29158 RepID=A0A8B6FBG9_MYTGA|nr:Hypothetical predicted protein [Mytilus galloprovincialis]
MNTVKNVGIVTVFLALLVHISQGRNIQLDCLELCAEGINPLKYNMDCDCFNSSPFQFVKRTVKLPFRYGKRSFMGYPSGLQQYFRNGYGVKSYDSNPFLSKEAYGDY